MNTAELQNIFILDEIKKLLEPGREKLPGEPIRVLTIEDTDSGFRFRDYTQEDADHNRFRIDIYDNALSGGLGLDKNVAQSMLEMQRDSNGKLQGVALPSDNTHTINSGAFTMLPGILELYGVDISKFNFTHIDNYIWGPRKFPEGANENDFAIRLRKYLIDELEKLGLPENQFFPIEACSSVKKAKEYIKILEKQWSELNIGLVMLGLGDVPEIHYAYVLKNTKLTTGFRVARNSASTLKTHRYERNEKIPDFSITAGPANILPIKRKFISAFGKKYAERIKVLFSQLPSKKIVSSVFLENEYRHGVVFSLDKESAQYILESIDEAK